MPHIVPAVDSLEPDLSPISELLNMARAQHEITDDYLLEVHPCYSLYLLFVRSACDCGGSSSSSSSSGSGSGCSGSGDYCRCGTSSDGFHKGGGEKLKYTFQSAYVYYLCRKVGW